jgi:hypothetical protein
MGVSEERRKSLIPQALRERLRAAFGNPDADDPQFWPPGGKSVRTLRKEGKRFAVWTITRRQED